MPKQTPDAQSEEQPWFDPSIAQLLGLSVPAEEPAAPPAAVPEPEILPGEEAPKEEPELEHVVAQARSRIGARLWVYGVVGVAIALLMVSALLLNRLDIVGYKTLAAENSSIAYPEGLTLRVDPDTFTDRLRVRISSVPRLEFLEGSAGDDLRQAVAALPPNLTVRSPLYQIETRGESSQPVMVDVTIPEGAGPWETLDLYTWSGQEWQWVGGELDDEITGHELIRVRLDAADIPDNLIVVQAGAVTPALSASWDPDDDPITAAADVLDEVNPTGLLLGTDGGFVGDPGSLPQRTAGSAYIILPALRNWAPGATINLGLLSDVLTIPAIRDAHIANIVQLCIEWGFAGVEIDYRGVSPDQRESFRDWIAALADAMHAEGLRLNVVVEPPTLSDGGWDSGGYDWVKLGAVADALEAPFPEDPTVYVEGGQAQRLLDWATAQVDRYKLRMRVSSLSAEQSAEGAAYISLEQALAHFGEITLLNPTDTGLVEPGDQVEFGLSGRLSSITHQEATGAYRLEYASEDGDTRTVWLNTAASLAAKLEWARRYHLGGVAVADMLDSGNGPGVVDAATGRTPEAGPEIQVVWTVSTAAATIDQQLAPLTDPAYTWIALVPPGDYTVKATVGGFDHGSVPIIVAGPEPEVTDVITTTEPPTSTLASETAISETVVTADCLGGRYVADVTVPDNTRMEQGARFVKTWRMRNSGACDWPEDTVLARVESQLGGPESVPVGAVAVGETVEISVDLIAPKEDGVFKGIWVLKTGGIEIPKAKVTAVIQVGEGTPGG